MSRPRGLRPPKATRTTDRPIFRWSPQGRIWYSVTTGVWIYESESHPRIITFNLGYKGPWAVGDKAIDEPLVFPRFQDVMVFVDQAEGSP